MNKCSGPDCALAQIAYAKGGGDWLEQVRRAEIAPGAVERECKAGNFGACEGLHAAYSGGASRLPEDAAKAKEFGEKANELLDRQCRMGDRDACGLLVERLLYSEPTDAARGRRLADDACSVGSYRECSTLGDFLSRVGANRDETAANSYFTRAVAAAQPRCDEGNPGACELIAQAYMHGRGVEHDEKKATEYMKKAAELLRQ